MINEVANGFFTCKIKEERRRGKDITVSKHDNATKVHEEKIQHILEPVNPEAFMGVMPCGTRNVLAKSLDLPSQLEDCCQRFVNGSPVKIDVISAAVTRISKNDMIDSNIDEGRKKLITTMTMAAIANGRFLGGGFMAATKTHTSDGLLDVVILKNSGSLKILDEFVKMRGEDNNNKNNGDEYTDDGNMLFTKAKKLSMKSMEQEKKILRLL